MNLSFSAVIPLGLLMKKPASLNYTYMVDLLRTKKTFIIQKVDCKTKGTFPSQNIKCISSVVAWELIVDT